MKRSEVEGGRGIRPLRPAHAGVSGREASGEESPRCGEEATGCDYGCQADEGVWSFGEQRGGEDFGGLQCQGMVCFFVNGSVFEIPDESTSHNKRINLL